MSLPQLVLCRLDVVQRIRRVFVYAVDHDLVLVDEGAELLEHACDVVQAPLDGFDCLVALGVVWVHLHLLCGIPLIDFSSDLRITDWLSILDLIHLVDMMGQKLPLVAKTGATAHVRLASAIRSRLLLHSASHNLFFFCLLLLHAGLMFLQEKLEGYHGLLQTHSDNGGGRLDRCLFLAPFLLR